jgi:transcriptional regulator with XRE-family HTH domain
LNNRIRELRIEKKITQLQLSIELDVTQETISAYEHNRHMPSLTALIKMSEIFNTSMDYIMGLSNVRHILIESDKSATEAEQKAKLLYCYQRLGTKNKAKLVAYAEGLMDSVKE